MEKEKGDEKYRIRKKEARKELRKWKRKGRDGGEYREKKKEYKELCERKKKEENEKWEKKTMEARRERDMWEIVHKERKRGGRINKGIISKEKWVNYFMELLGGVRSRVVRKKKRRDKERKE